MSSQDIQVVKLPLDGPLRGRRLRMAAIVGLTVLLSSPVFVATAREQNAKVAATEAFWRVEGQPCALLSAVRFRAVSRPPSATPYDDAVYARHGGGMFCTHRTDRIAGADVRYPVCKFDSPDYLAVSMAGRTQFYDLTMGRAAAIGVVNGEVACVVVPKFRM